VTVEYSVISIGTLSHNPLWGERAPVRTAHATTTIVRDGGRSILVDPSLPAPALEARYFERTGGRLADVTDVFCTTLRPVHRRGVQALRGARWWAARVEIETHVEYLSSALASAERLGSERAEETQADLELLKRFSPAPQRFGDQIEVYPLAGPTPGSAGLLLTPATKTIVIAGDAALTAQHVDMGRVWEGCADRQAALTSLADMVELADVIICGHDNLMLCPRMLA